jgi:hypothetical protein
MSPVVMKEIKKLASPAALLGRGLTQKIEKISA